MIVCPFFVKHYWISKIYALLSQNFVVRIYALFLQIFLDWKVKSADIFTFWTYGILWQCFWYLDWEYVPKVFLSIANLWLEQVNVELWIQAGFWGKKSGSGQVVSLEAAVKAGQWVWADVAPVVEVSLLSICQQRPLYLLSMLPPVQTVCFEHWTMDILHGRSQKRLQ